MSRNIEIQAILKNSSKFEGKVYEFEVESERGGYFSSDIDMIKNTLENEECVFYNPSQLKNFIRVYNKKFDFHPGKITVSNYDDFYFSLYIDDKIQIYSLRSTFEFLSPGLDLNECVAILNKINTIGLIPFVKTYLELKENELTGLQALSDVSEKVSTKMSQLIQHISSIKQWLFLND